MWVFLKALLPLAAGALVFLILEITFLNLENTREKERLFNQQEESFREILKRGNPDELRVMIDTCYQAALTAASLGDEESCNRYMLWRKDCSEKLRGNANQQRPKVVEPTH
ncbi:MAG: hypothetical protein M1150_00185 [Patescibacteria group bacterium]|nr:hypothetical protein [Patescibacteria group bacterium]